MSIYKSSTLAMIPTAYKDGKLYSVRPTDGSGDFTFSRGTTATRVASSGYIEKGRENLLLQSNTFDTTWTQSDIATLTSGQSGYDGTSDAWLVEKSASSNGYLRQNISSSGVHTFSLYAKSSTLNGVLIQTRGASTKSAQFDLSTGTLGTAANNIDAKIEDVGSGWYRCSVSVNDSAITQVRVFICDDGTTIGATAGSIYIQDAQLESGLVSTSVIETTTTSVSAGILEDMPRLDYSGGASCPALLLEPQRSNLITHSELLTDSSWTNQLGSTIDVGQASSVSGYNDAWKLNKASGTFKSLRLQKTLASDNYSLTWFLKAGTISIAEFRFDGGLGAQFIDFDLSNGTHGTNANLSNIEMTPFNDGWYRCSASINTNLTNVHLYVDDASVSSGAGYIYAQYPQLEAGSYPTSYIPTYGASVTRSVDQLETSPYDYQSQGVLGANVGTIILDCETIGTSTGSNDFHMFGGAQSIADGYLFRANTGTTIDILERVSNGTSAQWTSIATKQTRNKIGVSYSGADVDVYVNGVAKSVSSGTPVGGGNINGFSNSGSNAAGLIIHQILLFPNKLTDSEMASITTL